MKRKDAALDFQFSAIGVVHTPFREKYGIPRQPGLVSAAKGVIKINDTPDLRTALKSLEQFSHLWIVFVFHEHGGKSWKPSIRPPRLGGATKVGVLASRSPHRPNPIGISAVSIEKVDYEALGGPEIHVSGVDLLDGTPVLDLKPYIPYADSIPAANAGWAEQPIDRYKVDYSPKVLTFLLDHHELRAMIQEMMELDPRPAYQKRQLPATDAKNAGLKFGIEILGAEVKYEIIEGGFRVTSVTL